MEQMQDLIQSGDLVAFTPEIQKTVKDILDEINLEGKYFAVLVNGKHASENTTVKPGDTVHILPKIAGG